MGTKSFAIGNGLKVTGSAEFTGSPILSETGSTKTFTVTVADKTAAHPNYGTGSDSGYLINDIEGPWLTLTQGTYKFDQSDSTNSGHPFRFSETNHGTHNSGSEYTTGVTTNGTPGSAGAYTQIVVSSATPRVLYTYCTAHNGMGHGLTNIGSEASSSAGASLQDRGTAAATTATIGVDVADNITISGYDTYCLLKVQTSIAAWVTIYTSNVARANDSGRDINTDPDPGTGVICEVINTGGTTQNLSPGVIGYNESESDSGNIYLKVVNKSGSTNPVTVTLTLVQLEN